MKTKNKLLLITGIISIVVLIIIVIWAIDTGRFGISASEDDVKIQSSETLRRLPSPDESTFAKFFSFLLKPFIK